MYTPAWAGLLLSSWPPESDTGVSVVTSVSEPEAGPAPVSVEQAPSAAELFEELSSVCPGFCTSLSCSCGFPSWFS